MSPTEQALRGDRANSEVQAVQAARELSQYGQRQIASGRTRINTGREKIRRGERLVARGSDQVARSRTAYEARLAQSGEQDPVLVRLREEWDAGIEMIREGNALIGEGRRDVETGQLDVREGRIVMETAAPLIRSAERSAQEPLAR